MVCQISKGLSDYERFVKIQRVCQDIQGLSDYERFVKILEACQIMKDLSKYEGYFKIFNVCQDIHGLSKYEGFVKVEFTSGIVIKAFQKLPIPPWKAIRNNIFLTAPETPPGSSM